VSVDEMLEYISVPQFKEWVAFYKIRYEREKEPRSNYGKSREEQQRMSGDILRQMTAYQKRQPK
jgi:hypothetical protein